MAITNMTNMGNNKGGSDQFELFKLKNIGICREAFLNNCLTRSRTFVQSIDNGKGATFPILGKQSAGFLAKGYSTDDIRKAGQDTEVQININGLLVAPALFFDLDRWMDHTDKYTKKVAEMGKVLALAFDQGVFSAAATAANAKKENITSETGAADKLETTFATPTAISEAHGLELYNQLLNLGASWDTKAVPDTQRYVYMPPVQFRSLYAAFDLLNRNYGAGAAITDGGNTMRLGGFEIIKASGLGVNYVADTNIRSGETIQYPSALVGKTAFLAIWGDAVGAVMLRDIQFERGRRIEVQADEVVAKLSAGFGVIRPEAVGVCVYTAD